MARKSRRQKQQDEVSKESEMDMTPMIDVVFLLIIFFLCIDFKVLEAKLPAYLPKDKGSQPEEVEPQEQLRIKIVCEQRGTETRRNPESKTSKAYYLVGHKVTFTVGAKKIETLEELKTELEEIYKDPEREVPDPKTGGKKKMSVVVEPGTDVVYGDVAPCVDAISTTGFRDINFGGGLGSSKTGAYARQPKKK